MIVSRMVKHSQALLALLIVLVVSSLVLGMSMPPASESAPPETAAAEADSSPSVDSIALGLYGDITIPVVVDSLSEGSDNLTFVGTSNGLYVVAPGGKLQHFLYSPFGIKHIALVDDITNDGIREVVVALNDTQVPALRCYNGATWEKLWQFAPMAKVWDQLWVERQLSITNLEVIEDGDSQRLLITSGRCVLSVNAEEGTEQWRFSASSSLWRMVTLADLNNDGADEVIVGADDGHLFWLSVSTGNVQWQTKLPDHRDKTTDYNETQRLMSDIITLDEETGKVVVASTDGWVHMYDLREKRREWDTLVFENDATDSYSPSDYVLMSPTADITGDGLAEVLLSKTRFDYQYSGAMTNGETALCDSAGNIVWNESSSSVWPGMAFETGVFEGKPVYLDRTKPQEIALVDVKDGESVLHTIPLDALYGAGVIMRQPGGDGYLSFSSNSDLAAISATGELLWYYPRITSINAEDVSFVGDGTEYVFLWGESGGTSYDKSYSEPEVRLLRMMDGATRDTIWSYELPYSELKNVGGLQGIQVTADLVGGDNAQDIISYREDTVFIFNGRTGASSSFPAGQPIASLGVICNGVSGNVIAVGIAGGLSIFDSAGTPLWSTTSTEWVGDESGSFMVLDDVNSDNVSDLAVVAAAKIVVLKSIGSAGDYELHLAFEAEAGSSIEYSELVPDADKDGVRDLAYIQRAAVQTGQTQPCPLLLERSLADGKELVRFQLPGQWPALDLACADFNGDGYTDSLVSWYSVETCGTATPQEGFTTGMTVELLVFSGKDGSILWTHSVEAQLYVPSGGWNTRKPPAASIGDVNDDGADDLAFSSDPGIAANTGNTYVESRLELWDVAHDKSLPSIPMTPSLKESSGEYYQRESTSMLWADVDVDGHLEAIVEVSEPWIPSYDPDTSSTPYSSDYDRYLAVVDIDSGQRLAGFTGFNTTTMSLFETQQPGILGVAACGGVYFLDVNTHLQVTSPEDGARTGPTVGVRWEGPTDSDFFQVFVDGVCNEITNGFEADLYLGRGEHAVVVRSVDDYGRISYSPSDLSDPLSIKVAPSPWKPVWLMLALFVLTVAILLLFYPRLHRMWRSRRRAAK